MTEQQWLTSDDPRQMLALLDKLGANMTVEELMVVGRYNPSGIFLGRS